MSTAGQTAKDKGNAAFKASDFPAAVGHYSAAMLADPSNPTYPLNRAAAYLKLGKHEDAERDCTTTLRLDGRNVKALFRRAQARVALQKLQDAQADLKQALATEPANAPVKQELMRVEESLKQQSKPRQKRQPIGVSPVPAPPAPPMSTPKRRRIPIEIVEAPSAVPGSSAPAPPDGLLTPVSSRPLAPPSLPKADPTPAAASATPQAKPPPATFRQAKDARESARSRPGGGIFRADGTHTLFSAKEKETGNEEGRDKDGARRESDVRANGSPMPGVSDVTPVVPAAIHGVPKAKTPMTLFAFTRRWERLKTAEARWALINEVAPQAFPSLFQSSLEASLLTTLLDVFRTALQAPSATPATQERVRAYMQHLALVTRFATVVLFMSTDERAVVRAVWDLIDGPGVEGGARQAWGVS